MSWLLFVCAHICEYVSHIPWLRVLQAIRTFRAAKLIHIQVLSAFADSVVLIRIVTFSGQRPDPPRPVENGFITLLLHNVGLM